MADKTKVKYYQLELVDSITGSDLEPSFLASLATREYVDGIKQSLDIKDSVRVTVSTDVPLTPGSATFNGVPIGVGERLLLIGQNNAEENGIYTFNGVSNILTRSVDADDANKVTLGLYTYTELGTNSGKAFVLYSVSSSPIVIGTTELLFTQFSGSNIETTDDLLEGSSNLYFTDVRAKAALVADLANKANSIHTHTTSDITNLSSYTGFDSRYYTETEVADLLLGKSATSHTHTFASLTSKPTTLSGYGITDAYPLSGNPSGFLTSIGGIAAGGDLAGTYPNPTVTNSSVIAKVLTGLNITGGAISALDSILVASGKLQNQINGKAAISHTHATSDITSVLAAGNLGANWMRLTSDANAILGGYTPTLELVSTNYPGLLIKDTSTYGHFIGMGADKRLRFINIASTTSEQINFGQAGIISGISIANNSAGTGVEFVNTATGGKIWSIFSTGAGGYFAPTGSLSFYGGDAGYAFTMTKEGAVSIGIAAPVSTAQLQVESTTKGFLQPRMTTTNQNAISSPATGLGIYNTTLNQMSFYNGSAWVQGWSTRGNLGTNISTDFIGTTDNTNLVFKVNNVTTGVFYTSGGVALGGNSGSGSSAIDNVGNGIAIGSHAQNNGYLGLAIGYAANCASGESIAIGRETFAANLGFAFGYGTRAENRAGMAFGLYARSIHDGATIFTDGTQWSAYFESDGVNQFKTLYTGGYKLYNTTSNAALIISASAVVTMSDLVGTGIRMVVASSTGILSTQPIPVAGAPGGSTNQMQYNNGGAFGGTSGLTWDSTNNRMKFGGGTKTSELSIISSAAFGDGNIYIESSNSTGASIVMNSTNTTGRKFILLNRPAGQLAIFDYGISMDVAQFDGTRYNTIQVQGTNTTGAGISIQSQATGGDNWLLLSTANASPMSGGKFGIFGAGDYRFVIDGAGHIGIGTYNPDSKALLHLASTTNGFIMPRMNTTERNAIAAPPEGLEIFNNTNHLPEFYNGTSWVQSWSTKGNNAVAGDFFGTINSVDLEFRRGNVRSGLIDVNNLNTYFGYGAALTNAGQYNTIFGDHAVYGTGVGSGIVSIGYASLFGLTNGSYNTAVGHNAGGAITGGGSNTIVGAFAMYINGVNASNNTSIGRNSLYTTSGSYNVAVGNQAGETLTIGSYNIVIGHAQNLASNTANQQMNIGGLLFGIGMSGSVSSPAGQLGILTNAPTVGYALDVNGDIKAIRINVGTITSTGNATSAIGDSGSISGGSTYSWIMGGYSNSITGGYITSISGGSSNAISGTNNNVAATQSANIPTGTNNNSIVGGRTNQIFAGTSTGNDIVGSTGSFIYSNKNFNKIFATGAYAQYNGGMYLSDNAASGGGYLTANTDDQFVARFLNGYLFKTANNVTIMILDANGSLGLGTTSVTASAIMDVVSTSKGILIPRMTTTNRNAISSPATGLMIFNTTNVAFEFYNGSAWVAMAGSGGGGISGLQAGYLPRASSPTTIVDSIIYDATNRIGIGISAPDGCALLHMDSTNAGFLMPQMNTAQRMTVVAPIDGLQLVNTDTKLIENYANGIWEDKTFKPIRNVQVNYTVTASDYTINCTSGSINISLVSCSSALKGRIYVIKNSGPGIVTVIPAGANTIDAVGPVSLSPTDAVTIQCTGGTWVII